MAAAPGFTAPLSMRTRHSLTGTQRWEWNRLSVPLHTLVQCQRGVRCSSAGAPGVPLGSSGDPASEAEMLTAEFMRYVAETGQEWPSTNPSPTALMPPNAVVKAQMDSLMRNDWPDADTGISTAFRFAMPEGANEMIVGDYTVRRARSWEALETYLTPEQFQGLFRQVAYSSLINCSSWEFCSPLTFHRRGDENALQAVRVTFVQPDGEDKGALKESVFTFILQKVVQGPFKQCWMVIGVRLGDYANV